MKFPGVFLALPVASLLCAPTASHAGHDVDHRKVLPDRAVSYDFDRPQKTDHVLYDHLTFSLGSEIDSHVEHDFDLDARRGPQSGQIEPSITATVSYDPTPSFRATGEVELTRIFRLYDRKDHNDWELNLKQAYVTLRDVLPGTTVEIGRRDYKDPRQWLFDEELDGVRVVHRWDSYAVELAATREELLRKDLLNPRSDERINNYYIGGTARIGEKSSGTAYVLYRDDLSPSGEDLLFTGVQSQGRLFGSTDYWLEAAVVTGDERGRDILGYGIDLGATHVFKDTAWEPSVTAGFAYGSGNRSGGTDTAFRQTGLHDNSASFNGAAGFQYYGEVLDPELSNLGIVTLGAGIRPTPKSSVDVVYHYYYQPVPDDDFRDVAIDRDPNGLSRDIGHEVDLVFGYRELENVKLELSGGVFLPGSAFDGNRDPALFVSAYVAVGF